MLVSDLVSWTVYRTLLIWFDFPFPFSFKGYFLVLSTSTCHVPWVGCFSIFVPAHFYVRIFVCTYLILYSWCLESSKEIVKASPLFPPLWNECYLYHILTFRVLCIYVTKKLFIPGIIFFFFFAVHQAGKAHWHHKVQSFILKNLWMHFSVQGHTVIHAREEELGWLLELRE